MITKDQYLPILKGKLGEFKALKCLELSAKKKITPIIEIVPVPTDFDTDEPSKTIDEHLSSLPDRILQYWGKDQVIYVDGYMIMSEHQMLNGVHPMVSIFEELGKRMINSIPVTGNDRDQEYDVAISHIVSDYKNGLCFRLFYDLSVDINSEIDRLLTLYKLQTNEVDLIIDLRSIEKNEIDDLYDITIEALSRVPQLEDWRSLILSCSGFPINLSEIPRDQIKLISRKEWLLWQSIVQESGIKRIPSFSDYAISHPEILEIDPRIMSVSAGIRYTGNEVWYIYRGKSVNIYGYEQFFDLSETLINSSEYCGQEHCFGDKYIFECGTNREKTGNHTTWRQVGTNHHISSVVDQLRQFFLDFNASRTS